MLLLLSLSTLASAASPNVILITLDSTRADRMGFLGARHPTPAADALSRQSLIFEHAYAQTPLTVASHTAILTGTYPQTNQATEFGSPLPSALPYLPDLFRARGYRTAAFVASITLDPKNGSASGFNRGFSTYDAGFHQPQKGESRSQSLERRGEQVAARATAWLARNSKGPFFLWIHLNDAHAPYGTSYDNAVGRADAAVGKVLAALRASKLLDDAAVVLTADHGESLGAHGEDTHGVFLYDETIHVPLLLKLPQNQMAAKRIPSKVRLVDVAPTLLEVAGLPVPSQMQGESLLRIAKSSGGDQPVYSRSDFPQRAFGWSSLESWRAGKYLYIRAPKPELYDLSADPGATRNLAQTSKATLDTMAGQLETFDRHFTAAGKATELTSSEVQKLASLGYVGLQKSAGTSTSVTGTDPKDAIATANKVIAALLADGNEKSASTLQSVVSSQPNTYLAQYGLGAILARQQQYPTAIEHLHKAIELQPDSAWAHYYMGQSLLKTGDAKTAVVHLEIATTRLPENAEAHAMLAQAYEKIGRTEDAKKEKLKAGLKT
ncbi:MAG TPA: sulfatase-like hydrolase/transferase [Terriglobales bacterium]|nr:sulfatase-like hydrolase/transferase [Terriglobales bacterium]